jgi:hypothetical protein
MIWRSVIVAGYVALAIVIGVAYGARGLEVLFFYYFWAGGWFAFILVWGRAARAAGRWNYQRVESAHEDHRRNNSSRGEAVEEPTLSAQAATRPAGINPPQPVPSISLS